LLFVVAVVVVAAQDKEASDACWNPNRGHRCAGLHDNHRFSEHRHHWRNLYTVADPQQLRCEDGKERIDSFGYLLAAAGDDAVLLLENYRRPYT